MNKRLKIREITEVVIARLDEPAFITCRENVIALLLPVYDVDAAWLLDVINDAIDVIRSQSDETGFSTNREHQ